MSKRTIAWTAPLVIGAATIFAAEPARQQIEQLERQVVAHPGSVEANETLAEAYLQNVELEKSLRQWRTVLRVAPHHGRAQYVIGRLTEQALDLDRHLDALAALIAKGMTDGIGSLLDAAGQRAATDDQKATIIYLRGRLAASQDKIAEASAHYLAVIKIYGGSEWAGRSAIELARVELQTGRPDRARRLLRKLISDEAIDNALRQEARLELALVESVGCTHAEVVAAIEVILPTLTVAEVKRRALHRLIKARNAIHGRWVPESVDDMAAILKTNPSHEQILTSLSALLKVVRTTDDSLTLDRLLALHNVVTYADTALAREAEFIYVETLLRRAVPERDVNAMRTYVARAAQLLDDLASGGQNYPDRHRVTSLRGRAYLVEGQKLAALVGATEALPLLVQAKDHYLAVVDKNPNEAFERLSSIGTLLEHMHEWEMAAALYRQIATGFAHTAHARDALLKVARLQVGPLDAPSTALETYAEYAARYPAELPYRQLSVGKRLRRLGYANLLDFQTRNGLKPDGIFGPKSRGRLAELEQSFDQISAQHHHQAGILRGRFVHPTIFRIARRLEGAGRHHDAIGGYRLLLNLFPTKKEADDALIAIARLFRDNLLFAEALGAYEQLMNEYPKGDVTSDAYIEAATCLENLGRWEEAKLLYDMYAKKFPKFKYVQLCKDHIALLDEILQYEELIANNPQNPKLAEAQYQIARILYKQFKNYTKAAVEFAKVAAHHPAQVRAADALFSAGTAQMRAENFTAARVLFRRLVDRYPDSRLADDGQFWIGHTFEYRARALGKLDAKRIILKKRSLEAREALTADLAMRQYYDPDAQLGPQVDKDVWGGDVLGVLTSGSVRDRMNVDLFNAIRAYRKVVVQFKFGDMAGNALLRIGTIYTEYLDDPDKGIEAYKELLAHYPGSKQAVDALFEVGAYQLSEDQYDQAIESYQQFIFNHPTDPKVEDAMMAIARAYVEKKAWARALDAYQSYLNKHPEGAHVEFAKAQVDWIRMYHF